MITINYYRKIVVILGVSQVGPWLYLKIFGSLTGPNTRKWPDLEYYNIVIFALNFNNHSKKY